ncbi:hypothetical protein K501DRAFT_279088 [Backusella circina FSU 941]|nr:hypothetical protein K501DRAFT_279088 [Backusella circina FSU 941]
MPRLAKGSRRSSVDTITASFFLVFDEYMKKKKSRATIIGFTNDNNSKGIITDWLSSYNLYDDAKSGFERVFLAASPKSFSRKLLQLNAQVHILDTLQFRVFPKSGKSKLSFIYRKMYILVELCGFITHHIPVFITNNNDKLDCCQPKFITECLLIFYRDGNCNIFPLSMID